MPTTSPPPASRPLGTMVAYGFPRGHLTTDLAIAARLGASVLEVLPDWGNDPDPVELRKQVRDAGFVVHSAHGCWGGQSIRAPRVDLADPDPDRQRWAIDDLKLCVDWLADAAGTCLVVHPGGLSDPEDFDRRRAALAGGLIELADHARGAGVVVCVENMPRGVHPGSRMVDLAALVGELGRDEIALALDTGHAQLSETPRDASLAAGPLLRTTHVHDNDGRQDAHLPPGCGTIDWDDWRAALDEVGYGGPIMLECILHLREHPVSLNEALQLLLDRLTGRAR